jgi:hypothetical protein
MKRIAFFSMFLALGLFAGGCGDTAKQTDKSSKSTTVKEDKDTGEKTVETKEDSSYKDSDTDEKVETSKEEETTIKPPQDGDSDLDGGATTDPVDDATTTDLKTDDTDNQ